MNIFEYLNLYTQFFIHENEHLNIKTNLAVFSFSNAFLSFKKQEPKKESRST